MSEQEIKVGNTYTKRIGVKGNYGSLTGVITAIYDKFFVVDFGIYRESFSMISDKEGR